MYLHIISRRSALKHGLKKFFTGKPCINGGVDQRYASGRCLCAICKNKIRTKENINYSKNTAERRERQREYINKNIEKVVAYRKEYYKNNKGYLLEKRKEYIKRKPFKHKAQDSKRRASELQRVASWFGELDIFVAEEAKMLARDREVVTGIKWHVDHCVPLLSKTASGLHCAHNLQVIPGYLNSMKINKMIMIEPFDWISFA